MTQKQKKILKRNLIGYSFILPNFIGYFLFIFLPVIFTFVLCVMKWDGSSAPMEFVGLQNFVKLFHDSSFIISFKNTIYYALFTVSLPVIFTFVLCVMKWDGSSHCNSVKFQDQGNCDLPYRLLFPLCGIFGGCRCGLEYAVPAGVWTDQ